MGIGYCHICHDRIPCCQGQIVFSQPHLDHRVFLPFYQYEKRLLGSRPIMSTSDGKPLSQIHLNTDVRGQENYRLNQAHFEA